MAGISAAGLAYQPVFAGKAAQNRPNILYIMSDDHAAHALSCYGSKVNTTPNLDRIANEGMKFANCFATNSICAPSRAAILTGTYNHINNQETNHGNFNGDQVTYPKELQKAGYQTAMIGKWHLGSDPTGFDHWNVLPGQGDYVNPTFIDNGNTRQYTGYVTDIITDLTIDYLKDRDTSKPFMVMSQHKAPHRRWTYDEAHADMYTDPIPYPETFNDDYSNRSSAAANAENKILEDMRRLDTDGNPPGDLTEQEQKEWKYQRYMQKYLRCVASLDDNVGRLLDYLETSGLAENTIVIYTSDQGFFLGDHGWFDKRFMYEESIRMPFLIRYPGAIAEGSVSDDIVLNVDFAPTLLDFAGVAAPEVMQGMSFRSILQGQTPQNWRTSMYYRYYEKRLHNVCPHYGIRTDRYKLIHYYRMDDQVQIDEWELFDLQSDPNELYSVYNDPAYAETRDWLKYQLWQHQVDLNDPEPMEKPHAVGSQQKETRDSPRVSGHGSVTNLSGSLVVPAGALSVRLFDMHGRLRWSHERTKGLDTPEKVRVPRRLRNQVMNVQFTKQDQQ